MFVIFLVCLLNPPSPAVPVCLHHGDHHRGQTRLAVLYAPTPSKPKTQLGQFGGSIIFVESIK